MPEFEHKGWQGFWIPGRKISGQHGLTIIVKRRFRVDTMEATCVPDVTEPVALMQEPYDDGELPRVSMRAPGEIAVEKAKVDIIVRGTAYAPGGKPTPSFDVGLRIAHVLERRLRIFGDRTLVWYPPAKWLTAKDRMKGESWIWPDPDFSEPEPITKLPLRYEYAYGGWAKLIQTPDLAEIAAEAQDMGQVVEDRRQRKEEILAALKAEEAGDPKPPDEGDAPQDAKAAALAAAAFSDSGEAVLDDEARARLEAEAAADDGMEIVSAFRFKDEETTREGGEGEAPPVKDAGAGDTAAGDAPHTADSDEPESLWSSSEGTAVLDLNALKLEDEYARVLEAQDKARVDAIKDEEGTLRVRSEEASMIALADGSWAAKYLQKHPEKRQAAVETEIPEMPYPTNMAGRGFAVSFMEEAVKAVKLPNIEDPEALLGPEGYIVPLESLDLQNLRLPAGWGPYPMTAFPRAGYWGTYPWDMEAAREAIEAAKAPYDPDDPDDQMILEQLDKAEIPLIDIRAFQEAHPALQVPDIRGDEEVSFTNMTPEGQLYFRLPGVHPMVTLEMGEGPELVPLKIDQVLFDLEEPEAPAVELVWRGFYRLRDFEVLEERPLTHVQIWEADQEEMNTLREKMASRKRRAGEALIDDEAYDGEGLEEAYRQELLAKDALGLLDEISDAAVWDQDEERRLSSDAWAEKIRQDKEDFVARQKAIAETEAALRERALKAKAREMVDEEFGIIRDPETGEILAIEDKPQPED